VQLVVEARGLHKHFGALHVLKGVDLLLAERELVFVIGPSGSGKSTLLRCLNRLEEPSSGSVVVDGVDMLDPRTDINHVRQRIGMVFQSFNLYPHMTRSATSRWRCARSRASRAPKPTSSAAPRWRASASPTAPATRPASSPAASSSASRSRARSRSSRA
jgi:ABC-type polar amino acid transport system ATPase subunit